MKKKCLSCGKPKGFFEFNYAGYEVKKSYYPFPARISEITLAGSKKKDFLCQSCANKTKIICSLHGEIIDSEFKSGQPPHCIKCDQEKREDTRFGSPPDGFDALEVVSVPTNHPVKRAIFENMYLLDHPCSCGGQWKMLVHNAPDFDGTSGGGYVCTICKKKKWFLYTL